MNETTRICLAVMMAVARRLVEADHTYAPEAGRVGISINFAGGMDDVWGKTLGSLGWPHRRVGAARRGFGMKVISTRGPARPKASRRKLHGNHRRFETRDLLKAILSQQRTLNG